MSDNLNELALGYAGAIVAAVSMLLLGIIGNFGAYSGAVNMMQHWHMFFSLSIGGIIGGMLEASVLSFVALYIFAWAYNKLV